MEWAIQYGEDYYSCSITASEIRGMDDLKEAIRRQIPELSQEGEFKLKWNDPVLKRVCIYMYMWLERCIHKSIYILLSILDMLLCMHALMLPPSTFPHALRI